MATGETQTSLRRPLITCLINLLNNNHQREWKPDHPALISGQLSLIIIGSAMHQRVNHSDQLDHAEKCKTQAPAADEAAHQTRPIPQCAPSDTTQEKGPAGGGAAGPFSPPLHVAEGGMGWLS